MNTTKPAIGCAASNGKPGAPASMIKIGVRFAPLSPVELQIKQLMKSTLSQHQSPAPAPPQTAARPENFAPVSEPDAASSLAQMPFADLMLHPEKLEAALKTVGHSETELKETEFILKAPSAKSVQLAADFTDWEKCPLDMTRNRDGVWFVTVPLSTGSYAYRFIVDGKWCDDPRPVQNAASQSGASSAMIQVT